jgi:hypothetical protein
MSGGSMDYADLRVEEAANSFRLNTPRRKAFRKLMFLVAKAMHDIEWVDSGDCSEGSENAAIDACLTFNPARELLNEIKAEAEEMIVWIESKTNKEN